MNRLFRSPWMLALVGAVAGFGLAKIMGRNGAASHGAASDPLAGLGARNYPGLPTNSYVGREQAKGIMLALQGVGRSRLGSNGSGPQIPPFVAVDPSWARSPSMLNVPNRPNFIGRDHWWMPRVVTRPV